MAGYAVLVGVNEFEDFPEAELRFCDADARELGKTLSSSRVLSQKFEENYIRILTGANATRINVLQTISECFSAAGASDMVMLFVASHGYSKIKENFIYCYDSRGVGALRDRSSLSLTDIRSLMADSRAREKLILLDCCHASSADFIRGLPDGGGFSMRFAREEFRDVEFCFFNSCRENEFAYECPKLKHGVWSHFLIRALRGEDGWPESGRLTTQDLQVYLRRSVARYVKSEFGGIQNPDCEMKGGLGSILLGQRDRLGIKVSATKPRTKRQWRILKNKVDRLIALCRNDIAKVMSDLNQTATLDEIIHSCDDLESVAKAPIESPVAFLGFTGCGKTTLVNSLAGIVVGSAGTGGPQSASSLVLRPARDSYRAVARYVDFETLEEIIAMILDTEPDAADLFLEDSEQRLSSLQMDALSHLLKDPSVVASSSLGYLDLNPEIREVVESGERSIEVADGDVEKIADFVEEHTNADGEFAILTHEVEVSGPFPGLYSGIYLLDLPGLGELNPIRITKAKEALRRAQQLVVVTNDRGITGEIRDTLLELGMVSSVLVSPNIGQVIFVGTKIDEVRVSKSDRKKLGLSEDFAPREAVAARFAQWASIVKRQWKNVLEEEAMRAKAGGHRSVESVLDTTKFIPCSPEAYLCLRGLSRDPLNSFKATFEHRSQRALAESTGIGPVRSAIEELIKNQSMLREKRVETKSFRLVQRVNDACDPMLKSLDQEILLSKEEKRALDEALSTIEKASRSKSSQLDIQRKICDKIFSKLSNVEGIVGERWHRMERANIEKALRKHVGAMHFGVLSAAMRRLGVFVSRGKARTQVNVPERVGMAVRMPLLAFADDLISDFQNELQTRLDSVSDFFTGSVADVIHRYSGVGPAVSSFSSECIAIGDRLAGDVTELAEQCDARFNYVKAALPDLVDRAVGKGFGSVMYVALEEAKGRGARAKLIQTFAEVAERMRADICRRTSDGFCEELSGEIEAVGHEIENEYRSRVKNVVAKIVEVKDLAFHQQDIADRKRLAARLSKVLGRINRIKIT